MDFTLKQIPYLARIASDRSFHLDFVRDDIACGSRVDLPDADDRGFESGNPPRHDAMQRLQDEAEHPGRVAAEFRIRTMPAGSPDGPAKDIDVRHTDAVMQLNRTYWQPRAHMKCNRQLRSVVSTRLQQVRRAG